MGSCVATVAGDEANGSGVGHVVAPLAFSHAVLVGKGVAGQPEALARRPSVVPARQSFGAHSGLAQRAHPILGPLERVDLGAGRRRTGRKERTTTVGALARTSLTPWNEVASLGRWLLTIRSKGRWLELGTSLGTTSASVAALGWDVETWEGCPHTLDWAQRGWQELNVHASIQSKCGDFRTLVKDVPSEQLWDVVYVDGLHEEHATMDLIEALKSHVEVAVVLDDIAWSTGMHRAWKHLQDDPDWRVSFSWRGRGFLVKAPHMEPQRFRLA